MKAGIGATACSVLIVALVLLAMHALPVSVGWQYTSSARAPFSSTAWVIARRFAIPHQTSTWIAVAKIIRADSANCPAAARQFLQIVELGRQRQGRARLAEINSAVNFSIRPASDWGQHGVADFWSAPLATLRAGVGDCEDYAVLKYVALREAGIAPDDLRFLIVYYPRRRTNHAVVAVHLAEE
jgi:predicted transglutaminase-like cysteine proteinase